MGFWPGADIQCCVGESTVSHLQTLSAGGIANNFGGEMKLWLISQDRNGKYDVYSDAVVAAETIEEAKMIHPSGYHKDWDGTQDTYDTWCNVEFVKCHMIGTAKAGTKMGVICAAFHAG